ncbi:unnamed protein product [Angiostrongylus costaricensis]|uniref:Degenerin unc-8 n=1 Tax=Angiostrongylus costaricensis TaxID=334426 RepID=A0A158PJA0_ANGCS|nr:unnamed protein product [Angiostrongylus costaricensis]
MSNELRQRQPNYDQFAFSKPDTVLPANFDDDKPVKDKFKDFADKTTAHGAKRILIAQNDIGRLFWMSLMAFFLTLFLYQAGTLIMKYKKHDKITSISIKFDHLEFPAITFCNLNPYKKSLVGLVPSIRDTMDVYDNAKTDSKAGKPKKPKFRRKQYSSDSAKRVSARLEGNQKVLHLFEKEIAQEQEELRNEREARGAIRRIMKRDCGMVSKATDLLKKQIFQTVQFYGWKRVQTTFNPRYEAVEAHCRCVGNIDMECIRFETPPKDEVSFSESSKSMAKCVCTFDREMMVAWPCFNASVWFDHTCPSCKEDGYCEYALKESEVISGELLGWSCKCRNRTQSSDSLVQGMTDGVAMLTKAKENLMFTMSALSSEQRVALSQNKHEFIEMCSFNGHECNVDEDFRIHVDPEFGNCFTFNHDVNNNYTSSRAGPMYGIRVLLFVNTSDYMTTSESTGVRLAIHAPTEYPFPDTFGYSAPVGFASSFGMKKKLIQRLSKPYGDCIHSETYNKSDYIYQQYDYHPEVCRTDFHFR